MDIKPIDEHSPKYNISKEELEIANKKILELSNEKKENTVISGDKIIHKRTDADYDKLWKYFLENYEPDFKCYLNYGREKIEEIGVKKFIDTIDWRNEKDVGTYRDDVIKVIPCVHCGKEFALFWDVDLGLCKSCQSLYDMVQAKQNPDSSIIFGAGIPEFENLRKQYLKK